MLTRVRDQIAVCEEEIVLSRFKATLATDPRLRKEYRRLERHWREVAKTLRFATEISGYLQWTSRGLDPPPP
jgi:5'-deoxynucleotidase YfbR-like HD superfamily hydrolase